MPTFVQYNAETEALISYMLERLAEDDVLAGGMRYPNLIRAVTLVGPLRDNVNTYRRAVHRWADSDSDKVRKVWELVARYEAFWLRFGARQYMDREGFDRRWLRAPR